MMHIQNSQVGHRAVSYIGGFAPLPFIMVKKSYKFRNKYQFFYILLKWCNSAVIAGVKFLAYLWDPGGWVVAGTAGQSWQQAPDAGRKWALKGTGHWRVSAVGTNC